MRILSLIVLILFAASSAMAGGNPGVIAYVDFDPPNRVHEWWPAPYETISAYIVLGNLDEGVTSVSFALNDVMVEYPGCVATQVLISLFPGNIAIPCDSWTTTGCTIASTECVPGPDAPVARLDMFYLGGSCCIKILDHAHYTRWVVDCSEPTGVDTYCLLAHGSVGGAVCPEGDCGTPVESETWGAMKALYR